METYIPPARHWFKTAKNPRGILFTDADGNSLALPWNSFLSCQLNPEEPDLLRIDFGDCLILVNGHNLEPLIFAIAEKSVCQLEAEPERMKELRYVADTFVTQIRFIEMHEEEGEAGDQLELELEDDDDEEEEDDENNNAATDREQPCVRRPSPGSSG